MDKNQVQSLRNGGFIVRAITRGYPLGEVAGGVGFLRKGRVVDTELLKG